MVSASCVPGASGRACSRPALRRHLAVVHALLVARLVSQPLLASLDGHVLAWCVEALALGRMHRPDHEGTAEQGRRNESTHGNLLCDPGGMQAVPMALRSLRQHPWP